MYIKSSTVTMSEMTLQDNTAVSSSTSTASGQGGAIFVESGTVTMSATNIVENFAGSSTYSVS